MGQVFKVSNSGNPGDMSNAVTYDGYAITPSDTLATYQAQTPSMNGQPRTANALVATGVAGTVALVLDAAGATATVTVGEANDIYPIDFIQIKATGTTATGIYALFAPQ